jgi:hypothetical protein
VGVGGPAALLFPCFVRGLRFAGPFRLWVQLAPQPKALNSRGLVGLLVARNILKFRLVTTVDMTPRRSVSVDRNKSIQPCHPVSRRGKAGDTVITLYDTTITWRLEPQGEGTNLSLEHKGFDLDSPMGKAAFQGMSNGWAMVLARLENAIA